MSTSNNRYNVTTKKRGGAIHVESDLLGNQLVVVFCNKHLLAILDAFEGEVIDCALVGRNGDTWFWNIQYWDVR